MAELSKEEQDILGKQAQKLVGERIRQLREAKDLSQTELAERIYSDRQYLYKIESGKVGTSVAKLAIIANALETSMSQLLEIEV